MALFKVLAPVILGDCCVGFVSFCLFAVLLTSVLVDFIRFLLLALDLLS